MAGQVGEWGVGPCVGWGGWPGGGLGGGSVVTFKQPERVFVWWSKKHAPKQETWRKIEVVLRKVVITWRKVAKCWRKKFNGQVWAQTTTRLAHMCRPGAQQLYLASELTYLQMSGHLSTGIVQNIGKTWASFERFLKALSPS